ncbi:hypothetical protein A7975_32020 [Bacillus sp. FJAT-26390]|nr:hypothetical protein A7975_32020 [Bacillus sp. FJAT-26390]
MLVDSQRGQPSFESASHHDVWQWESRMGLKVVWSAERKYAPGSFVPSCCIKKCAIIRVGRLRHIIYDVHFAAQGRQQRIVCVKDHKRNESSALKLSICSSRVEPRDYTPLQHNMLQRLFLFYWNHMSA